MRHEAIKPSEIKIGDKMVHYGVVFEITGRRVYPDLHHASIAHDAYGPCIPVYVHQTKLISHPGKGCTMPLSWAKDWRFQGNDLARFNRLLAS